MVRRHDFESGRALLPHRHPTDRRGRLRGLFAPVLLAVLAMLLFAACDEEESKAPDTGVTAEDVTDQPGDFLGEAVTVSGAIEEVVGQRAFTIGDDELLVVGARTLPQWLGPDFDEEAFLDDDGDWDEFEDPIAMVHRTAPRFALAEVERVRVQT